MPAISDNTTSARRKIVVCDNGTGFVKCGFAGDNLPRAVFPCAVGRPVLRYDTSLGAQAAQEVVVGQACCEQQRALQVSYPIDCGIVQNWDDMCRVWDYTFQEHLNIDPSECKILLTDPPLNPKANRTRLLETMFERYGFAGAFIQVQAVLTLYAQGLMTGVVVDSGDGVTHMVPVVDGFSFPHLTKRIDTAGRSVTAFLVDLLLRRGYALSKATNFEAVRRLKEQLCYIALDYDKELKLAKETTHMMRSYTLPDGRVIKVGAERFMAPEIMFTPSLADAEGNGISEALFNCIQGADIDNRMALYKHVVLSGGSTMCPGMASRIEKDVRALYLQKVLKGHTDGLKKLKLRVEDPPRRKTSVFLGGAVLADIMKDREEFWISRAEWEEDPHRALLKCGTV